MKNAMKKLMSLVLVAILLVSAVPFQASAAGYTVNLEVKYEDGENIFGPEDVAIQYSTASAQSLLNAYITAEYEGITKTYIREKAGATPIDGTDVPAGYLATIVVSRKAATEPTPTPTPTPTPDPAPAPVAKNVTVRVKIDGAEEAPKTITCQYDTASVESLLNNAKAGWSNDYKFVTCWIKGTGEYVGLNDQVAIGSEVVIAIEKKAAAVAPINIVVKVDSSNNIVWTGSKVPANGKNANVKDLLDYCWNSDWDSVYTVDHVWSSEQQKNVSSSESVNAGDTVSFLLNKKSSSTSSTGTTSTTTNKFPYPVYLNIYKDTTVGSPDKRVEITNGIALDGTVSLSEVKTVVANYYNAKNSYGIGYDGLYLAEGNWVANYVADTQKYSSIDAGSMRQTGTVYINVMISNATAKTTSTADSSNPKTGDSIFMAVTVMGISATTLATALFFYNKKRLAK